MHPVARVPAESSRPAGAGRRRKVSDVPALIVSGEFDNITTLADGAAVASMFKHGRQLILANSFHVNALPRARSTCAALIVRRFIETLDAGDTACASQVPPMRLVAHFATRAEDIEPAQGLPGNAADQRALKVAAGAVLTAGDVLARRYGNSTGDGSGLRGGRFHIERSALGVRITLTRVRWSDDLAVSGVIEAPPGESGTVIAQLQVEEPRPEAGRLTVRWREGAADALAEIRGVLGGAAVAARTTAP